MPSCVYTFQMRKDKEKKEKKKEVKASINIT